MYVVSRKQACCSISHSTIDATHKRPSKWMRLTGLSVSCCFFFLSLFFRFIQKTTKTRVEITSIIEADSRYTQYVGPIYKSYHAMNILFIKFVVLFLYNVYASSLISFSIVFFSVRSLASNYMITIYHTMAQQFRFITENSQECANSAGHCVK